MQSNSTHQCHHIKTSGVRCGSPALRNRRYCYYHQRSRPLLLNFGDEGRAPQLFSLPPFEDAHSIQFTLRNVAHRLLDRTIGPKTAGLLLYALQIASSNLKNMKAEVPEPAQVVVDLPQLSEIDRPAPIPAPPDRMDSHTERRTLFPDTHPLTAEYEDDILRQQREVREELAFQIEETQPCAPNQSTQTESQTAAHNQPPAQQAQDNQSPESGKNAGDNDGLPPGTIQAQVRPSRSKRGANYVN